MPSAPPVARRTVLLLCCLFALRGIALICALPPGEMWDEYSHLAHVDHWAATGRSAVYGRTTVDPAFLVAVAALPQPTAAGFGRSYADFWAGHPAPPLPASLGLYEAQHPFLYYALAAPLYIMFGGRSNLPAAVAGLRLVNLTLGTAGLALILRWVRRRVGAPQWVVLGTWVALQPLLLLNVCRVADDALAFLLGTAVVVTALELTDDRLWRAAFALAVLLPLAILAKATNAALVPVAVVAMLGATAGGGRRTGVPPVPGSRRHGRDARATEHPLLEIPWRLRLRPRRALAVALIFAVTTAALWPYVAFNLRTFGFPTPMQEAVANHAAGRSAWAVLTATPPSRWPVWAASWWVANGLWVGGWSFLRPPRALVIAYGALLVPAIVAIVVRWRSLVLPLRARWPMLAVVGCVHLGLMVHATESYAAWDGRVLTNPWYAAVAVPWWLALLGSGALALRRLRPWVTLGVPAVFVAAETFGLFGRMLPAYYAAPALSPTGLRRMATLHPAILGPAAFAVAGVGVAVLLAVLGRRLRQAARTADDIGGFMCRRA